MTLLSLELSELKIVKERSTGLFEGLYLEKGVLVILWLVFDLVVASPVVSWIKSAGGHLLVPWLPQGLLARLWIIC